MRRVIAGLALFIVGCMGGDPDSEGIREGTYEVRRIAPGYLAIIQVDLEAEGTYGSKGYLKTDDGSVDCQITESTGRWMLEGSYLKVSGRKARGRDVCDASFSEWENRPDAGGEVRNITSTSFEAYEEGDATFPAEWIKYTRL